MKRIYISLALVGSLYAGLILSSASASAQSPFACMRQQIFTSQYGNGAQTGAFPCNATPETWTIPAGAVSVTVSGGAGIGYPWSGGPGDFTTADYGNCTGGSSPFSPQITISFSGPVRDVDISSSSTGATGAAPPSYQMRDNRGTVVQITPTPTANGGYFFPIAHFTGRDITSIVLTPIGTAVAPWAFSLGGMNFTPQCGVTSVQWQQLQGPLDTNPNTGGGTRIFPDRQTPTGLVMSRVRVAATTGLGANQPVYFRAFDLDDPSTDTSPVDTNGSNPDDNRGTPRAGTLSAASAQTDASGNAAVEFTVTMQPGDNFVVAASDDQAYLNGLTANGLDLQDASGQVLPTIRASRTQMLTVWRKLYVEVDSMGLVAGNSATGNTSTVTPNAASNQTVIAASSTLEVNRFQNGRIILNGVGSYPVVSNAANTVTVQGIINSVPRRTAYTLYDDDDFNSNDTGSLRGDVGEDVEPIQPANMFDTTFRLMQESDNAAVNIFAPAYIRPAYAWARNAGYNTSAVTFSLNVTDTATAIDTQLNRGRNTANNESSSFWVVYLQIGYQHQADGDNDPNGEPGGATTGVGGSWTGGIDTYSGTGAIPRGTDGSLIYVEVQRDVELNNGLVRLIRTVPHEVGHQFALAGDDAGNAYGVMSYGNDIQFAPDHLNVMRWRVSSPGKP